VLTLDIFRLSANFRTPQHSNMRKQLILFLPVALVVLLMLSGHLLPVSNNEKVDYYYIQQLQVLKQKLQTLQQSCINKSSVQVLQQQFKEARLAYKKLAVLTEYFNVYESKYLNGPALKRVEEDNPTVIVEPQGFQVVEEKLFGNWSGEKYKPVIEDLQQMLNTVKKLENEPDRMYKFRDERVFDALRAAVLRLITMGISGFDSPIAQCSLPEAAATIDGMQAIINLYRNELEKKQAGLYQSLSLQLAAAKKNLLTNKNFNSFDRLQFITQHANPLSAIIVKTRLQLGFVMPEERRPVNPDALTIFESNAFDIRFFSPADRYKITAERIELGRQLFYDPILSGTKNRSCATCHQPAKAFTDGLTTAISIDNKTNLTRNTPTLWNSALQTRQFFDSRTTTLEDQMSAVVHNPAEMQGSLEESIPLLQQHPAYKKLFQQAYPEHKEPIIQYNIGNAIASYIRSLVALNSRLDLYMRGDKTKLNAAEKNGFNLFMGRAKCGTCHYMPLFNGLVPTEFVETESEVLGVPRTNDKQKPVLDSDEGKFGFTRATVHRFAFKTPTLRNIALTAPYMHNGVFNTLEEVMEFYNNGGGSGLNIAPETQTLPSDKLKLTAKEMKDIIAFMKTLTDTTEKK
jgi:cytochrome c peroxidase